MKKNAIQVNLTEYLYIYISILPPKEEISSVTDLHEGDRSITVPVAKYRRSVRY